MNVLGGNMIKFKLNQELSNGQLNGLFKQAWKGFKKRDFQGVLGHSLLYVSAFSGTDLVGFVNVAWDGGIHGFILDTTVRPDFQRKGIGMALVKKAAAAAKKAGIKWLHADYERKYKGFYGRAGFRRTLAGLIRLDGAKGM